MFNSLLVFVNSRRAVEGKKSLKNVNSGRFTLFVLCHVKAFVWTQREANMNVMSFNFNSGICYVRRHYFRNKCLFVWQNHELMLSSLWHLFIYAIRKGSISEVHCSSRHSLQFQMISSESIVFPSGSAYYQWVRKERTYKGSIKKHNRCHSNSVT